MYTKLIGRWRKAEYLKPTPGGALFLAGRTRALLVHFPYHYDSREQREHLSGAYGDRTRDLLHAMQALYQLS